MDAIFDLISCLQFYLQSLNAILMQVALHCIDLEKIFALNSYFVTISWHKSRRCNIALRPAIARESSNFLSLISV